MNPPVKLEANYFVLLCATVLREAAGEVGVTGGAPVLRVILLLSGKRRTNMSQNFKTNPGALNNSSSLNLNKEIM